MALLDLLGHRWLLRVVWELRAGRLTFRELAVACGSPSPTVLNARLAELRDAALVDADEGYGLTPLGEQLLEHALPLAAFAEKWARALPRS